MTPGQALLFAMAHYLLLCALAGVRAEGLSFLAAVCTLLALAGLGGALEERRGRGP